MNGRAVDSDRDSTEGGIDSTEGGIDLGFPCGPPVRQICFGLWTDDVFEVWMMLIPSLSSLFTVSEGG